VKTGYKPVTYESNLVGTVNGSHDERDNILHLIPDAIVTQCYVTR